MSFKFIKGSVIFTTNRHQYKFDGLEIINEGIPEICTYSDNLNYKLDDYLIVKIKPDLTFKEIELEAQFFISNDSSGIFYGIKFIDTNNKELNDLLTKTGKDFTKWKRSTPRIPSSYFTNSIEQISVDVKSEKSTNYIKTNLLNVSLGGIGIFGTVQETIDFKLNNVLLFKVTSKNLENPILFTARVMRINTFSELRPGKGFVLFNHFGLKFVEFDEDNKKKFLNLVKIVIEKFNNK